MSAAQELKRTPSRLAIVIGILVALLLGFFTFAGLWADVLWFNQLGFSTVLFTAWFARIGSFLLGFSVMAIAAWLSLTISYRSRPMYLSQNTTFERYRDAVDPVRKLATWAVPAVLGVMAGSVVSANWEVIALWWNRQEFGSTDPLFGLDIGFFVFTLPFLRALASFVAAAVAVSGILAAVNYLLYDGIRIQGRSLVFTKAARIHLSLAAALFLLTQAAMFWLERYATVTAQNPLFAGANYTAVNATIPALNILSLAAIGVAALFFLTAFLNTARIAAIGVVSLVIVGILGSGVYPWIVQRFQVDPNAKTLEAEFISSNIEQTRAAFGLTDIETTSYDAVTTAEPGALKNDAETTASIRLMDPNVIAPAFAQLQQFKQYYSFPDVLDVDRYLIDGENQDTVTAVRDVNLDGLGDGATWFNSHLVYTHGYGTVLAAGNKREGDGAPVFLEGDMPTQGILGEFQPRVYFGQQSPEYSIVGATSSSTPIEVDYANSESDSATTKYTFTGDGGPKLDSVLNRIVYALKFQSEQILLSDAVTNDSQILYDRDPLTRVAKVAPYLRLDQDPYASVVDGRLVWIVDGYTLTNEFPYSRSIAWEAAISDSRTVNSFTSTPVNYVRNSVKATVDAYDGSVKLYAWEPDEPLLKAWQSVYGNELLPISEMSAELMSHVRYPTDLFMAQRLVLEQYHVTDPGSFYSKDDAWTTPNDPTAATAVESLQPPYYLTLQMPGQNAPSFSLYTTFIPDAAGENARNVLKGYLAVDSNAGAVAGTRADGYGKLRLLTLPEGNAVPGPGQVQAKFNADAEVSAFLNLLKRGQSTVTNGNLLTVPVGGGLLYVQPVYVSSTGETSYPLLQKVLVAFGDQIAFENTLEEALDSLFGGDSGADGGGEVAPEPSTPTDPTTPVSPDGGASVEQQVSALLNEANSLVQQKQAALAAGDLAEFERLDDRLAVVIAELVALTS